MNSPKQSIPYDTHRKPASLAGMLAPSSCQLTALEHGWELRLVGLGFREVVTILATTCESIRPGTLLIQDAPGSSSLQLRVLRSDNELPGLDEAPEPTCAIRLAESAVSLLEPPQPEVSSGALPASATPPDLGRADVAQAQPTL